MGTEITWVGEGVEEYGHVKGDPENILVRVDPRYFRPTEVELLLVSQATSLKPIQPGHKMDVYPRVLFPRLMGLRAGIESMFGAGAQLLPISGCSCSHIGGVA